MSHGLKSKQTNDTSFEACEFSKMSFELLALFHDMNSDERTRALRFARDIVAAKAANAA